MEILIKECRKNLIRLQVSVTNGYATETSRWRLAKSRSCRTRFAMLAQYIPFIFIVRVHFYVMCIFFFIKETT